MPTTAAMAWTVRFDNFDSTIHPGNLHAYNKEFIVYAY